MLCFNYPILHENRFMKKCWLATLLPFLLLSCKTKDLEYLGFEEFAVKKLGFQKSELGLKVVCYNPNKFSLRLLELNSDVYINDDYLGKAVLDSGLKVPKNDTFSIPVTMEVKMGPTFNEVMKLMSQATDSTLLHIRFNGNARVKKGGIVLNYPIQYDENKPVKF